MLQEALSFLSLQASVAEDWWAYVFKDEPFVLLADCTFTWVMSNAETIANDRPSGNNYTNKHYPCTSDVINYLASKLVLHKEL